MNWDTASAALRRREGIAILLLAVATNAIVLLGLPGLGLAGAALLLYLLPGWALLHWAAPLESDARRTDGVFHTWLQRLTLAVGLSLAVSATAMLLVHYLPGPMARWQVLAAADACIAAFWLGGLLRGQGRPSPTTREDRPSPTTREDRPSPTTREDRRGRRAGLAIAGVVLALALAGLLRFAWLGYSEFQGDEALVTWASARALLGEDDVLFLHGKSPAEVILPAAQWSLDGRLNEAGARLPFALAGCVAAAGAYLLGRRLFGDRAGLLALVLFAINGYFVGFSRVVQYQSLALSMGVLALLAAYLALAEDRDAYLILSGLCLGAGLLAHYDGLLAVLPALFLWAARIRRAPAPRRRLWWVGAGGLALTAGLAALFYLPLVRHAQFAQMFSYLSGSRVGHNLLNNHVPFLLLSNTVYNSTYYTALLVAALLGVWIWTLRWLPGRGWTGAALMALLASTAAFPSLWQVGDVNLAVAPFAVAIGLAACAPRMEAGQRAIWLWMGVAGAAYVYVLALPLSHVYAVMPAWVLLAAHGLDRGLRWALPAGLLSGDAEDPAGKIRGNGRHVALLGVAAAVAILAAYPYLVFVRHDPEFARAYADRPLPLYWRPYDRLPAVGLFGFPHRSGWKAIGQLYATGALAGDYLSNEEEWVTLWYTHFAPRSCGPEADYYFTAANAWDPTPLPDDLIAAKYAPAGAVAVGGERRIDIHKRKAPGGGPEIGEVDAGAAEGAFDLTARPERFVQRAAPRVALPVAFGDDVELLGYDLEQADARPGGRLAVTLYWRARRPLADDLHAFVQVGDGTAWAQSDSAPVCGRLPATLWRPGQVVVDRHTLEVSPQAPAGKHPLRIGLYRAADGQRLPPASGDDGSRRVPAGEVEVSQ